ncbi:hypothetical protein FQR65_LT16824 [Abscondita terminalis]|nr:hypothetical protein FQR65_LT16824 [Abscondita terminalis]
MSRLSLKKIAPEVDQQKIVVLSDITIPELVFVVTIIFYFFLQNMLSGQVVQVEHQRNIVPVFEHEPSLEHFVQPVLPPRHETETDEIINLDNYPTPAHTTNVNNFSTHSRHPSIGKSWRRLKRHYDEIDNKSSSSEDEEEDQADDVVETMKTAFRDGLIEKKAKIQERNVILKKEIQKLNSEIKKKAQQLNNNNNVSKIEKLIDLLS